MTKFLKGPISQFGSMLALMSVLILAPGAANALLLEPGIAYHTGSYDGGSGNTGKVNGIGLDARAAYSFPVVFAGLDLTYMFGTSTPDNGSGADATAVALGPVVGASLPMIPLRFWLSYYLMDYLTLKVTAGDQIMSGSAIKLGAGYTVIPLLSLNLQYSMHTFTKVENKATNTTSDLSPSTKFNEFVISATIPLDF